MSGKVIGMRDIEEENEEKNVPKLHKEASEVEESRQDNKVIKLPNISIMTGYSNIAFNRNF